MHRVTHRPAAPGRLPSHRTDVINMVIGVDPIPICNLKALKTDFRLKLEYGTERSLVTDKQSDEINFFDPGSKQSEVSVTQLVSAVIAPTVNSELAKTKPRMS
ncbi:hypothetical protein EVAR_63033_1 [Eumeta japonica]|uniref:Uncharacterized protein n=1 Tax=Eumeta variegata TaxID=151549 RepID=A0A4C1Z4E6_EUMVA|nr:hypothetical protein EVAR_63033_1 [Eumeta japonica]